MSQDAEMLQRHHTDPTEDRLTDARLVARSVEGDHAAFTVLTERYFGMVFSLALATLAQPEAAEDLAQEVFLRVFLHLHKVDDPARFSAWLTRITRNLARDWARQQQTRSRFLHLVPLQEVAETVDAPQSPSPRKRIESDEQEQVLQAALARLDPTQRELVLLHYMEGRKKNEIAEALAVHPATIGRQLDKALAALGEDLRRAFGEAIPLAARRTLARGGTVALLAGLAALPAPARAALAEAGALHPGLLAPLPPPAGEAATVSLPFVGRIAAVALLVLTGALLVLQAVYTKASPPEEAILDEIKTKLAAVRSYSATRVVRRTTATPWNFREVVRFSRPDSYEIRRIHYGGLLQETADRFCYIVCDGATLRENIQARRSAAAPGADPADDSTILTGAEWSAPAPVSYDLRRLRSATDRKPANEYAPRLLRPFEGIDPASLDLISEAGNTWILDAKPTDPRPSLWRVRLTIRKEDGILTRMECFDAAGDSTLTETTEEVRLDSAPDNKPFLFTHPPQLAVTDATESFLSIQPSTDNHAAQNQPGEQ